MAAVDRRGYQKEDWDAFQGNFKTAFDKIKEEVETLRGGGQTSVDPANNAAKKVCQIVIDFQNLSMKDFGQDKDKIEQFLRKTEISLTPSIGYLLGVLQDNFFANHHTLKKEVSRTVSILLDLHVFDLGVKKDTLPDGLSQDFQGQIDDAISKNSKLEHYHTQHELICMQAALKVAKYYDGGKLEQVKKDIPPVLKGLAVTGVKAGINAAAPGACDMDASIVLDPAKTLAIDIYRYIEARREAEKFYPQVWAFRWFGVDHHINSIQQLEEMSSFFEKHKESRRISFLSLAYFESILKDENIDPKLKDYVFKESSPSIMSLVELNSRWFTGLFTPYKFAGVRYHALSCLEELSKKSGKFQKDSIQAIITRSAKDHGEVQQFAHQIVIEGNKNDPANWKETGKKVVSDEEMQVVANNVKQTQNEAKSLQREVEEAQVVRRTLVDSSSNKHCAVEKGLLIADKEHQLKVLEKELEEKQETLGYYQQQQRQMLELRKVLGFE